MEKFKFFIVSVMLFSFSGCNDDKNPIDSESIGYSALISVNPANSLLLKVEKEDGTVIEYYGEKDSEGQALTCNLVSVTTSDYDGPIYTEIDEEGRPLKVFGYEGASISFNYDDIDNIRIEVITSNGENRLSFPLNDYTSYNLDKKTESNINIRKGREIEVLKSPVLSDVDIDFCDDLSNLHMNITKCDEPFDNATVIMYAIGVDGENPYQARYESRSHGDGNYCFRIDKPEQSSIHADDLCNNLDNVLGNICIGLEPFDLGSELILCEYIAIAFNAAGLPAFAACATLVGSMKLYCETLGKSEQGGPSILSKLCDLEALDEDLPPTQFVFKAGIYIDGGDIITVNETNEFSTSGPFTDLDVSLPSTPIIAEFSTNPLDPNPGENYVATAVIKCIETSTSAIISVVGSDGYTSSKTIDIPAGNSSISLYVPGAEGGVLDKVSVEIEDGTTSTRVIIF